MAAVNASERLPYGRGVFRRRFLLRSRESAVTADMEDDFHRFRVVLEHDGECVRDMRGEARRYPWTECPGATEPLRALIGMPLSSNPRACARHTDPRLNCTHLFDVASLALTHAAAGREQRQYDLAVTDAVEARSSATLRRDGRLLFDWRMHRGRVIEPETFADVDLRGRGFQDWAESEHDPETAEAILMLRRACFIAMGRARDLDEAPSAEVYLPLARGSCHSFTPGIAERAWRMKGTQLDFSHRPEALLAELEPPYSGGDV
jgi:hypothetical protein